LVKLNSEPRKASDVLIDLESKINVLLQLVRSQDLNIKILSNKLNSLLENTKTNVNATAENLSFEDDSKKIYVSSDGNLPLDNFPSAIRRNSRPETYSSTSNNEVQVNKEAEVIVNIKDNSIKNGFIKLDPDKKTQPLIDKDRNDHLVIPVHQRVVDRNGKSIFLADVEVVNLETNNVIFKTRTNGTGKWMASLSPGNYNVIIQKRESVSKEKIKTEQLITVDAGTSLVELQMIILK
tara:strand:- start:13220 stop:13930 length:711 start_codon:yes stop_codon:yes gene_type:complete